jgi:acyl-CoA dehydrogenase
VESIDELRRQKLLAAVAPKELGGAGFDVAALVRIARQLARSCASTAMIWSMHQGQLASLCRFGQGGAALEALARTAVTQQWLIASATSEARSGGNLRSSDAAIDRTESTENTARLVKQATAVSYGAEADLWLVTARSSPEAPPSDQVLAAVLPGQAVIEQISEWAPMGMRGTCSPAFHIEATLPREQIFPVPFADIAAGAMVPLTQTLWAAVWLGLAREALDRAVAFIRRRVAGSPGGKAPSALAEARWRLAAAESLLDEMAERVDDLFADKAQPTLALSVQSNSLKVAASETALEIAFAALRTCGMAGYSETGPHSVARIIRDLSSAPIMIGNDRVLDNTAQMLLMERPGVR